MIPQNNILANKMIEWALKHKPEQTLVCVELGENVEYCYLEDCVILGSSIFWRYVSENQVQVLVYVTVPQILY